MLNLKLNRPLAIFDIESTGLNPRRDRIVELAAIKVWPDGHEESRCWLLNPTVSIPAETSAIHGITDAIVKDCPTFAEKAKEIYDFFKDADLGGFNSDHYDIPCLEEELLRAGYALNACARKRIDVQRIYHRMEPRTLTAAVKYYLGRSHDGAHGAEADARATLEVLDAQMKRYPELPRTVDELDEYLVPHDPLNADRNGLLRWKDGDLLVNFGKKRGESLKRLLVNEPNYLKWLVKGDFDADVRAIAQDLLDNGRLPPAPAAAKQ
ncbi:MAG TPA: DNA polymerase III subunit epsilon [Verrucomicrobia bacterium]|nr:DNA polymerase III subunit epsilon [Verrucomicrobiota bacterium]